MANYKKGNNNSFYFNNFPVNHEFNDIQKKEFMAV
jgi:hypothetical protein